MGINHSVAVLLCFFAGSAFAEEAVGYPRGESSNQFAELSFELIVPDVDPPASGFSLIVILHGNGGTATGMAQSLRALAERNFVVLAPKSTAMGWDDKDMGRVKEIVKHVLGVLPIDKARLHGAGFSNGGWNLETLVMDEEFNFVSACWLAAGFRGAKVPKRALTTMGGLALCGAEDGNRSAAEETVKLLSEKLRSVECRLQPNLGHEWPDQLIDYYFHWLEVMEGRLVAGDDRSFEWQTDEAAALAKMKEEKIAGLLWFYSASDVESAEGKVLQQEIFFDPLVRRFGSQLITIKLAREENEERFAELKLKKTPALVVLKPSGKTVKALQGKIPAEGLGALLRAVARDQTLPK